MRTIPMESSVASTSSKGPWHWARSRRRRTPTHGPMFPLERTTCRQSRTTTTVPPGSYSLTAVAKDDAEGSATSTVARITVQAANQIPTVAITRPADGATFTAPASITVTAAASDADGTIARVDFYANATLIG